jgi:hypothetical protein
VTNTPGDDAHLYPAFLKLEGRVVLVVGGGPIAERKVAGLLDARAHIRVVSPTATAAIQRLASAGTIDWHRRMFDNADVEDVWLVIAATADSPVQEQVAAAAGTRRCFVIHCVLGSGRTPPALHNRDLVVRGDAGAHAPRARSNRAGLARQRRDRAGQETSRKMADRGKADGRTLRRTCARTDEEVTGCMRPVLVGAERFYGTQQNVIARAGVAIPVADARLGWQMPPEGATARRKSPGCCTASHE